MLILHTYGYPMIVEIVREISYIELENHNDICIADGMSSQYPNEENNDLIYMGY